MRVVDNLKRLIPRPNCGPGRVWAASPSGFVCFLYLTQSGRLGRQNGREDIPGFLAQRDGFGQDRSSSSRVFPGQVSAASVQ